MLEAVFHNRLNQHARQGNIGAVRLTGGLEKETVRIADLHEFHITGRVLQFCLDCAKQSGIVGSVTQQLRKAVAEPDHSLRFAVIRAGADIADDVVDKVRGDLRLQRKIRCLLLVEPGLKHLVRRGFKLFCDRVVGVLQKLQITALEGNLQSVL